MNALVVSSTADARIAVMKANGSGAVRRGIKMKLIDYNKLIEEINKDIEADACKRTAQIIARRITSWIMNLSSAA